MDRKRVLYVNASTTQGKRLYLVLNISAFRMLCKNWKLCPEIRVRLKTWRLSPRLPDAFLEVFTVWSINAVERR